MAMMTRLINNNNNNSDSNNNRNKNNSNNNNKHNNKKNNKRGQRQNMSIFVGNKIGNIHKINSGIESTYGNSTIDGDTDADIDIRVVVNNIEEERYNEQEDKEEDEMSFSHESLLMQNDDDEISSKINSGDNSDMDIDSDEELDHYSSSMLDTTAGGEGGRKRLYRIRTGRMSIRGRQEEMMQRWFKSLKDWIRESHIVNRGDYNNSVSKNPSAWKQAYTSIRETSGLINHNSNASNYHNSYNHSSSIHRHKSNMNNSTNLLFHNSAPSLFRTTTRTLRSNPQKYTSNPICHELPNHDNVFPMGVKCTYDLRRALDGLGKVCANADRAQRMGRKGRSSELIIEKTAITKGLLKTILIIEDDSDRKEILDIPFVKLMFLTVAGIGANKTKLYTENEEGDGGDGDTPTTLPLPTRQVSVGSGLLDDDDDDYDEYFWNSDGDQEQPTKSFNNNKSNIFSEDMMDDVSTQTPSLLGKYLKNNNKKKKKIKCWFIEMLRCRSKLVNSRAVDYLESISSMNFRDYVECHDAINNQYGGRDYQRRRHNRRRNSTATSSSDDDGPTLALNSPGLANYDEKCFYEHLERLFSKIDHMKHLTALLVALPLDDIERVSTTAVIQWILQRRIRTSENVMVHFLDFGFHLCLLYTFRAQLLLAYTPGAPFQINALYQSPGGQLSEAFILRSLTFTSVAYFMLRQIEAYISMVSVSTKVCRKCFRQTGMWFEVFVSLFIILVNLLMIIIPREEVIQGPVLGLSCVALGLLWIRLIGFLQVANRKLATYYLAIFQIFSDIKLFVLVIIMTTLLFGDLYFIVFSSDASVCRPGISTGGLGTFDNDADTNPHCYSPFLSALSIYGLFVGSYNFEDFNKGVWTFTLFGPMTFFIILVMVNVLIAIVDESYEHSLLKSNRLFGRTRLFRISQADAMEDFVHSVNKSSSNRSTQRRLSLRLLVVVLLLCYMLTLLSVFATCGVGLGILIQDEFVKIIVLTLYGAYSIFILISVSLFSIHRFERGNKKMLYIQQEQDLVSEVQEFTMWQRWTYKSFLFQNTVSLPVQLFTLTLMGVRTPPSIRSLLAKEATWRGRLGHTDQVIRSAMNHVEHTMSTSLYELVQQMKEKERKLELKMEEREEEFRQMFDENNARHEQALAAILKTLGDGRGRSNTDSSGSPDRSNQMQTASVIRATSMPTRGSANITPRPLGDHSFGSLLMRSQPDVGLDPVSITTRSMRKK